MKSLKLTLLMAVIAVGAVLLLHRNSMAQVSNLRIVAPENGQRISTNFVEVRFELLNPAAAASSMPTYQLQLDGDDPVQTNSATYTFSGLKPGKHTVLVELVDANGTPVAGSINAVQFTVVQPRPGTPPGPGASRSPGKQAQVEAVAQHSKKPRNAPQQLPDAGSALPLLSIIGFGVLVGGIASALKTR